MTHILKLPVVAAMFGTWTKDSIKATDFWRAVRDETGETPICPDRKLVKYLTNARQRGANATPTPNTRSSKLSPVREIYVKCIHAWNAWRRNMGTELKYYADKEIPSIA